MVKARLVYDGTCPVCTNYVRLVRKKISPELLDFIPSTGNLNDFQYINSANQVYQGNTAIEILAKDFPEILDYMWMLPEKYKLAGLKTAVAVGGAIRKVIKKGWLHILDTLLFTVTIIFW